VCGCLHKEFRGRRPDLELAQERVAKGCLFEEAREWSLVAGIFQCPVFSI
jgi:hypothetical protein